MIDGIIPPRRTNESPQDRHRPENFGNRAEEPTHIQGSAFLTPDQVSHQDTLPVPQPEEVDSSVPAYTAQAEQAKPKRSSRLLRLLSNLNKKTVIISVIALFLVIGGGIAAYVLVSRDAQPESDNSNASVTEEIKTEPEPSTVASSLTGVQIAPELANKPVVGVIIENSQAARPQSGLKDAGVVFEAIAEGGITRFMALYQENQPDYIGPVRSVRPYFLDWLQGFDAGIAHVGGSPEALQKIRNEGIKDLDQFVNSGVYQRVSSRYAPHNMYSNVASLAALSAEKGWPTSSFMGFVRKTESPEANQQPVASIDLTISSPLYNVHYDYDAISNSYLRSEGGQKHIDERSGAQISPKVVIAMVTPYSKHSDGVHSVYQTIGGGKALIFQDGGAIIGTWSKSSAKEQIRFGDANGSPLGINPGQTWITAVGTEGSVAYQ